jgi:DNA-damage-inducible protein J
MALSTEIRCRIDQQLKEDAQQILRRCGLSISHAIRIFLRQVVAAGGLPFEVKATGVATQARQVRARYIAAKARSGSEGKKRSVKKRSRKSKP